MTADYWTILARVTPHHADDIDDLTAPFGPRPDAPGQDVFPAFDAFPFPEPRFKRDDAICVGFRVSGALPDAAARAMRLAALALERDTGIIVLSEDGLAGLERFGFRVERVPPATAETHDDWSEQVRRFWGLDQIL
ncbi:hypothetical protein [uncultured Jannaschia sp.]|uniref:hypothetical protein n=1 Tax=uncultured Jannaschia sp. TaxID=293347 RepID=UPI00261DCB5B|nr:hypothetical protein [uncultured Jannaschia sp.]